MRGVSWSISGAVMAVALCLVPAGGARAAAISTLYNTGVSNTRTILADGSKELHYSLVQQPGTSYGVQVDGASLGNKSGMDNTKSQFIGPNSNTNADGPGGTYIYRTTFTMAGLNAATAVISGIWSADDLGLDIQLNGTSIGITSQPSYYNSTTFKILSGFVTGINTLDFVLRNDQGATGLRVQMAGTANVIPEPASLLLLAMGVGGLVLARRRSGSSAA